MTDKTSPTRSSAVPSPTDSSAGSPSRPWTILLGFVLLVFATGSAEFLVSGVLPELAADLSVSIAAAGQTVTAYTLGVALGGPIVTALSARLPSKGLALGMGAVFILGVVMTALAPSFAWVIAGRVVSAASQATLFAIGLGTAASIMGPAKQGQAIAILSSGLTMATVLGVPLGTLLGSQSNWRVPFAAIAVITVAGMAVLAVFMPRTPAPSTGVRSEIRTLLSAPVLLAVLTTVIGFAGVSIIFTYLVPLLTEVSGIPARMIPVLLLIYGVGGFIGNLIAERLADRSLSRPLMGVFLALAAVMSAFALLASFVVPTVLLVIVLGLLSTTAIAPLQSLVLRHATSAPTLSLAVNVGAFNLANDIGSALGGLGVAWALLRFNGFVGAAFAILGLVVAVLALRVPAPSAPPDTAPDDRVSTEESTP